MTSPEYIPQYLPILIKHGKTIARRLKAMARGTKDSARWCEAAALALPCSRCKGKGCYTKARDGTRRPFDHRDFVPGDRFIATCPKCRGGGQRSCSVEELRRAYRKTRKRVCRERGFEADAFDRMVRMHLSKDPSPAAWYEAAKRVALTFGIETADL